MSYFHLPVKNLYVSYKNIYADRGQSFACLFVILLYFFTSWGMEDYLKSDFIFPCVSMQNNSQEAKATAILRNIPSEGIPIGHYLLETPSWKAFDRLLNGIDLIINFDIQKNIIRVCNAAGENLFVALVNKRQFSRADHVLSIYLNQHFGFGSNSNADAYYVSYQELNVAINQLVSSKYKIYRESLAHRVIAYIVSVEERYRQAQTKKAQQVIFCYEMIPPKVCKQKGVFNAQSLRGTRKPLIEEEQVIEKIVAQIKSNKSNNQSAKISSQCTRTSVKRKRDPST